jgi:hypothetical protein
MDISALAPSITLRTMAIASTSQHPISEDDIFHTPVVLKETSGVGYRSGDFEEGRVADLGPTIPQVSFQSFLSILLPSTYDVPKTIRKLEQGGHILQGRWAVFPVDPAQSASLEDATFAPLQGLFWSIIKCHSNLKSVVTFVHNPYLTPWFERSNQTRPDGYFILKDPSPPTAEAKGKATGRKVREDEVLVKWDNIVMSAEFEKDSVPDARDDVGNLVLCLSLCLLDDSERSQDSMESAACHA